MYLIKDAATISGYPVRGLAVKASYIGNRPNPYSRPGSRLRDQVIVI